MLCAEAAFYVASVLIVQAVLFCGSMAVWGLWGRSRVMVAGVGLWGGVLLFSSSRLFSSIGAWPSGVCIGAEWGYRGRSGVIGVV